MMKVVNITRIISTTLSIIAVILSAIIPDKSEIMVSFAIYFSVTGISLGIDVIIEKLNGGREQIADIVLRVITIEEQTK